MATIGVVGGGFNARATRAVIYGLSRIVYMVQIRRLGCDFDHTSHVSFVWNLTVCPAGLPKTRHLIYLTTVVGTVGHGRPEMTQRRFLGDTA